MLYNVRRVMFGELGTSFSCGYLCFAFVYKAWNIFSFCKAFCYLHTKIVFWIKFDLGKLLMWFHWCVFSLVVSLWGLQCKVYLILKISFHTFFLFQMFIKFQLFSISNKYYMNMNNAHFYQLFHNFTIKGHYRSQLSISSA